MSQDNNRLLETSELYQELDKRNQEWTKVYSNQMDHMNDIYHPKAILLPESNKHIQNNQAISSYYQNLFIKTGVITNLNVTYRTKLNGNDKMVFELGNFTASSNDLYHYMIIWSVYDSRWVRELEAVAKAEKHSYISDPVESVRERWGKMASENGSEMLVSNLYTDDCLYYNRGNLTSGQKDLTQLYKFMDNPNYQIYLTLNKNVIVNENLVYEIGNWIMPNYQDKYFVIWQKDSSGNWRMKLDSNW